MKKNLVWSSSNDRDDDDDNYDDDDRDDGDNNCLDDNDGDDDDFDYYYYYYPITCHLYLGQLSTRDLLDDHGVPLRNLELKIDYRGVW